MKNKRYRRSNVFIVFITFLLTSITASAQTTASIRGTITDDTGVPGVAVTVTNIGTAQKRNVVANERGQYSALSLEVGQYEIRAESGGFTPIVRSGIKLVVVQQAVVDIQLKVGAVQDTLKVTEEVPLVDTTPQSTAGLINEEQVKDLPLNGRSWDTLVSLNPSTTNFTSNQFDHQHRQGTRLQRPSVNFNSD